MHNDILKNTRDTRPGLYTLYNILVWVGLQVAARAVNPAGLVSHAHLIDGCSGGDLLRLSLGHPGARRRWMVRAAPRGGRI